MTQKDFTELARIIRFFTDDPVAHQPTIDRMALQVAYTCRESNPRFRPDKFFEACGVSEKVKRAYAHRQLIMFGGGRDAT